MKGLAIDYAILLPALLPVAGLVLVLVADLVNPRLRRVPYAIAGLAALGSAAATVPGLGLGGGSTRETFCLTGRELAGTAPTVDGLPQVCLWQADALGGTLQLAAAVSALVCIALAWPGARRRRPTDSTREPVEAVLLLAALAGTVVVAASRDVGTWLVALELATLPVIALVALSGRRSAVAGATQLLVTSLVSFALLVLGVALWFAATGSPFLTPDAALSSGGAFSAAPGGPDDRRLPVRLGRGRRPRHGPRRRRCRLQALARAVPRVDAHGIRRLVGARRDLPRDGLQDRRARGAARRAPGGRRPRDPCAAVDRAARRRSA